MINAIPAGKKNILLTPLNIMKITPLIAKSIAAVLYGFELSNDLLFIVKSIYLILDTGISMIIKLMTVNIYVRSDIRFGESLDSEEIGSVGI